MTLHVIPVNPVSAVGTYLNMNFCRSAAVATLPEHRAVLAEDVVAVHVLEQLAVARLVLLLNVADLAERLVGVVAQGEELAIATRISRGEELVLGPPQREVARVQREIGVELLACQVEREFGALDHLLVAPQHGGVDARLIKSGQIQVYTVIGGAGALRHFVQQGAGAASNLKDAAGRHQACLLEKIISYRFGPARLLGVANVFSATVDQPENSIFLAGTWRFRLDPENVGVPKRWFTEKLDDAVTLPIISLGGTGIISVVSNEIPREMAEMTRAALNNDWETARRLHRKYLPLMQANFIESNPIPVKAVLAMMGRIEENYRLPLVRMKPENRAKLEKIVQQLELEKMASVAS